MEECQSPSNDVIQQQPAPSLCGSCVTYTLSLLLSSSMKFRPCNQNMKAFRIIKEKTKRIGNTWSGTSQKPMNRRGRLVKTQNISLKKSASNPNLQLWPDSNSSKLGETPEKHGQLSTVGFFGPPKPTLQRSPCGLSYVGMHPHWPHLFQPAKIWKLALSSCCLTKATVDEHGLKRVVHHEEAL